MTGLDRLRGYARRMDELHVWPGGAKLLGIADQIEHEHAEDCFRMGERAAEDAEAAAWVREHGGLSHVKDILHDFRAAVERIGVEWSESELHGLMDALDRRLMPEGCEWPRYEDGEPVRIGDKAIRYEEDFEVRYIGPYSDGSFLLNFWTYSRGERVRRPAVLASDGEPLEVGQAVWLADGSEWLVEELVEYGALCFDGDRRRTLDPSQLTHTKPEPPDSWERIEEDALSFVEDNTGIPHDQDQMERDMLAILRRCKALAKRGE